MRKQQEATTTAGLLKYFYCACLQLNLLVEMRLLNSITSIADYFKNINGLLS